MTNPATSSERASPSERIASGARTRSPFLDCRAGQLASGGPRRRSRWLAGVVVIATAFTQNEARRAIAEELTLVGDTQPRDTSNSTAVLSDRVDLKQYQLAREDFEKSLASLQVMSRSWPEPDAVKWAAELTATYERWAKLPQQLFELHDDPIKNRPALQLARFHVQPLRVQILGEIDTMIGIQKTREAASQNRELMADLAGFESSFDAMATNVMAYGASGEADFKIGYGSQLATNAVIWKSLSAKRSRLSAEQRTRLDVIAQQRAEVAELALQIVGILN